MDINEKVSLRSIVEIAENTVSLSRQRQLALKPMLKALNGSYEQTCTDIDVLSGQLEILRNKEDNTEPNVQIIKSYERLLSITDEQKDSLQIQIDEIEMELSELQENESSAISLRLVNHQQLEDAEYFEVTGNGQRFAQRASLDFSKPTAEKEIERKFFKRIVTFIKELFRK